MQQKQGRYNPSMPDDEKKSRRDAGERIRAEKIKLMDLENRIHKLEIADLERRITALEKAKGTQEAGSL
jgi:hypothetical protein